MAAVSVTQAFIIRKKKAEGTQNIVACGRVVCASGRHTSFFFWLILVKFIRLPAIDVANA